MNDLVDQTHKGLMDQVYARQRYIYDMTRKYYLLGRDHLIDDIAPSAGDHVLEIACGTGRNLILAAQKYPDSLFYGLDISTEMLISARGNIAKYGLQERICVVHADASAFDSKSLFGVDVFDRVFLSYSLSMIPPWQQALLQSVSCLAPNGTLHVVDFGQQDELPSLFKSVLTFWLKQFHVVPRAELDNALRDIVNGDDYKLEAERLYRDYARYFKVCAA